MGKDYHIRKALASDVPDLVILCKEHAAYEAYAWTAQHQEVKLSSALKAELLHCFVVEHYGELAGYATWMKHFSTWEADHFIYLDCLYLKPVARNRGIGEKLMELIREEARKAGCSWLEWQTPVSNCRAISFYKRIGGAAKTKERFVLKV